MKQVNKIKTLNIKPYTEMVNDLGPVNVNKTIIHK